MTAGADIARTCGACASAASSCNAAGASAPGALALRCRRSAVDGDSRASGFTVTKKTGNSPERNRIKRRLRAAVQGLRSTGFLPQHDYVLVGRREALTCPLRSWSPTSTPPSPKSHARTARPRELQTE